MCPDSVNTLLLGNGLEAFQAVLAFSFGTGRELEGAVQCCFFSLALDSIYMFITCIHVCVLAFIKTVCISIWLKCIIYVADLWTHLEVGRKVVQ